MTFYFFNSYQLSPIGFQLSCLAGWDSPLYPIQTDKIVPLEVQSVLTRSGAISALGYGEGFYYYLLRGVCVTDDTGRQWYLNLALTADEESKPVFQFTVSKIFLDYPGFLSTLKKCFYPVSEGPLSYGIHSQYLQEWAEVSQNPSQEFYQTPHFATECFSALLSDVSDGTISHLLMLVPESTVNYFVTQNSCFSNDVPSYQFSADIFRLLLYRDGALFERTEPVQHSNTSPKQENPVEQSHCFSRNQLGLTQEQMETISLVGKIAAVVATCATVAHIIKKWKGK